MEKSEPIYIIIDESNDESLIIAVIFKQYLPIFIEKSKEKMMKSNPLLKITNITHYPLHEILKYKGQFIEDNEWELNFTIKERNLNEIGVM